MAALSVDALAQPSVSKQNMMSLRKKSSMSSVFWKSVKRPAASSNRATSTSKLESASEAAVPGGRGLAEGQVGKDMTPAHGRYLGDGGQAFRHIRKFLASGRRQGPAAFQ
jgi:hypothetical protein